jgi:hypothetical protein
MGEWFHFNLVVMPLQYPNPYFPLIGWVDEGKKYNAHYALEFYGELSS